jgi:hypothetical protein
MSYENALKDYTLKDIFDTKLHGEPFDILRKDLASDMFWLTERGIFEEGNPNRYGEMTYVCKYPVRIYYTIGKLPSTHRRSDWLTPGDIWTF